ncbi:MAG: hypothetical protein OS130_08165 [Thermodesulfobacteriota bacterium]|nr:MAG: hypothetical protein OS130_08165 [Thermodesulfobacteriota bacterium]
MKKLEKKDNTVSPAKEGEERRKTAGDTHEGIEEKSFFFLFMTIIS